MDSYDVKVFWDPTASMWVAVCDEIPLALCENTIEALIEDVKTTAAELFELKNEPVNGQVFDFHLQERLERLVAT